MNIKEIAAEATLPLRNAVLRPGKNVSECHFDGDDAAETRHFGALDDGQQVLGIISIYRNPCLRLGDNHEFQIRGMATTVSCRGRGFGRLLLDAAEQYAKSCRAQAIWANARSSALGFYTRAGYRVASEEFMIDGVGPHFIVTKVLA